MPVLESGACMYVGLRRAETEKWICVCVCLPGGRGVFSSAGVGASGDCEPWGSSSRDHCPSKWGCSFSCPCHGQSQACWACVQPGPVAAWVLWWGGEGLTSAPLEDAAVPQKRPKPLFRFVSWFLCGCKGSTSHFNSFLICRIAGVVGLGQIAVAMNNFSKHILKVLFICLCVCVFIFMFGSLLTPLKNLFRWMHEFTDTHFAYFT